MLAYKVAPISADSRTAFPAASTCVTHPNLRVTTISATEATPGRGYIPHTGNDDDAAANLAAALQINSETLHARRSANGFKHCETLNREECQARFEGAKFTVDGNEKSECVASSMVPSGDADTDLVNDYLMFSPAYLVDKLDMSIDKALCRYSGAFDNADSCVGAYSLVDFGHHTTAVEGKHTGYEYKNGKFVEADADGSPNYKADKADNGQDYDVTEATNQGGEFWLRVGEQNPDVRALRDVGRHELLAADVDAISVAALAFYTRKLASNTDYATAGDDELSEFQRENRRLLLEAIPGTCFSPGVSGSLLYSEGWGAAYFSLGILLVVAHLVWLAAAMMGESMEMVRFNAKRAMSFLGILVGLIGLCTFVCAYSPSFLFGPPVNHHPLPFPATRPAVLHLRLWTGRNH